MAGAPPDGQSRAAPLPPRGKRRRWPWVLLLVVLVATWAAWRQRDLPRRTVERTLAEQIGADVRLGRLEVRGTREFVLHDLVVTMMRSEPRLVSLTVARVEADGGLGEMRASRFRDVRIIGVELRLAAPHRETEPAEPAKLFVEHLSIEGGLVVFESAAEEARFALSAELRHLGEGSEGEVRLVAPDVPLEPMVAVFAAAGGAAAGGVSATLHGFDAILRWTEGGARIDLAGGSASTTIVLAGRRTELAGLRLDATGTRDADGPLRIEAHPVFPGVRAASAELLVDPASCRLRGGTAEILGIDLAVVPSMLLPLPAGLDLEGLLDLHLSAENPDRPSYSAALQLVHLRYPTGEAEVEAFGASLTARGEVAWPGADPASDTLRLEVEGRVGRLCVRGGTLDLAGSDLRTSVGGTWNLARQASEGPLAFSIEAQRLAGEIQGRPLPAEIAPAALAGSGEVTAEPVWSYRGGLALRTAGLGTFETDGVLATGPGLPAEFDWNWREARLETLAALEALGLPPTAERLSARGAVEAEGTLRGGIERPELAGEVSVADLEATGTGAGPVTAWTLAGGAARARFAWSGARVAWPSLEISGTLAAPPLDNVSVALEAAGDIDPRTGAVRVSQAQLHLGELATLRAKGTWIPQDAGPPLLLEVELERALLARWQSWLAPLAGDVLGGYTAGGGAQARLRASRSRDGSWTGGGTASVLDTRITSRDGSRVIEGLETTWELSLINGHREALALEGRAPVGGFVLLWDSVFADYSERRGDLRVRFELPGESEPRPVPPWRLEADLIAGDAAEINVELSGRDEGGLDYHVEATASDLERTFERWVRQPLGESVTTLGRIAGGGSLDVAAAGRLSAAERSLAGNVRLRGGRLEGVQGTIFVVGLDLDLPLDLRWEARPGGAFEPVATPRGSGALEFSRLALGEVSFAKTATGLVVEGDSVSLLEELTVPLLGGTLSLEDLTLAETLRPSRRFEAGVRFSGVQLAALTGVLGVLPVEGTLEGRFPRVRLSESRLAVEGAGDFSVFGGRVEIGAISGEEVFSRFPELKFSATFHDIDLLQVTRKFDFGDMSGIVEGQIDNCELFRWVPVRCTARIVSVRRDGVSQTINVKAIENIAILGSGTRIGVFDRGVHRFFDRYNYAALGLSMALDRDAFVLRGLERRGDRELFIRGRLPFRIDVVNVAPGNAVSFRSMLERLKNLDVSTTAPGPE